MITVSPLSRNVPTRRTSFKINVGNSSALPKIHSQLCKSALYVLDYEVTRLTSSVYAWIFSIPFPYLGIDGTSACNNLSLRNGTPTTCPIRKGQQYIYKNAVEIKAAYPKVILEITSIFPSECEYKFM